MTRGKPLIENIEFVNGDPKYLSDLAIKENLYVRGWQLRPVLEAIRDFGLGRDQQIIVMALGGYPVACCTLSDGAVEIFVRKAYRRYGIGSKMIEILKNKFPIEEMHAAEGLKGSLEFWKKNGIKI